MIHSVTAKIAEFIENTALADLPQSVVDKARGLATDFLGVAMRGSSEPAVRIMLETLAPEGFRPEATIIGTTGKTTALWAALVNGVAGHALDFDDTSQIMYGHPTVPVLPAALAVAEMQGRGGSDLLVAYVVGVEVATKLAYGMNPAHYKLGWHSTCTLGTMGATAAAAKLLGLEGEKLLWALALGASQAGGLQQNFGTMGKPFHAGKAAQNGLMAALLAQRGFTGDEAILDAPLGFFRVFTGGRTADEQMIVEKLGNPFEIDYPGVIIKKHPSCAFTHPPIDAALEITSEPGFHMDDVERVTGVIHRLANQILIHKQPRTGLEAKFSLEGSLALAFCDRKLTEDSFTEQSLDRPEIRFLLDRIEREVLTDEAEEPSDFGPAEVKVKFNSGREASAKVTKARGTPANPMSEQELAEKYLNCCSPALSAGQIEKSLALLGKLEQLPELSSLMACYRLQKG